MRIAVILLLFFSVASALPQGLLHSIISALGIDDDTPKTSPKSTLAPPTTRPSVTSTKLSATTTFSRPTSRLIGSAISTSFSSSTRSTSSTDSDSDSQTSTTSDISTITSPPLITITNIPNPTTPTPSPTAIASPPAQSSNNGVPAGGIAVAVIMSLLIVAAIAWLIFRYHPGIRRWWLAREDKKMQERSYRAAIDGPFSRGGNGVRTDALGTPIPGSRKSMLQSFFAPRTVRLGDGKEIRRKPVNWGAGADPSTPELPGAPMEKVALTNMAAPMARSDSTMSFRSGMSGGSSRSSPAVPQRELAGSPVYEIPPVPAIPPMPARSPVIPQPQLQPRQQQQPPPPQLQPQPQQLQPAHRLDVYQAELAGSPVPTVTPPPTLPAMTPMEPLSPISPLSRANSEAQLPPPPPPPPIPPPQPVHQILTRKSIYELA